MYNSRLLSIQKTMKLGTRDRYCLCTYIRACVMVVFYRLPGLSLALQYFLVNFSTLATYMRVANGRNMYEIVVRGKVIGVASSASNVLLSQDFPTITPVLSQSK